MADLPPLEPLNVTLARANRGIMGIRLGMIGDAHENLLAFARGGLSNLGARTIGNADHIAAAYGNIAFAEFVLRSTAEEIQKHQLPRNTRANVAGVALLAASVSVHGALLTHIRDGWMQLNALNLCRAGIELTAKACFIAVGTANEAELWERGQLQAGRAVALLSAELQTSNPTAEDAVAVYRWLCGFTHGQGSVIEQGPPPTEHAYAAFAFVSWTCAVVAETIIGVRDHATYPTVLPAVLPWKP